VRRALLFAIALATGSCGGRDDDEEVTFPADFLWGSATAGYQVEKGLTNTDWGIWADTPGKIKNGDHPERSQTPDALDPRIVDVHVQLMRTFHLNAYRFSIEWARIFKTRADFDANRADPAGVAAYRYLFDALRREGITPFVTLHHFAFPDYVSDPRRSEEPQGWERAESVDLFATWCGRAATLFGSEVPYWATINEPMVPLLAGYLQGSFPPGLVLKIDRALVAGRNEARAHAKCYDAVKAARPSSQVGIVQHLRVCEPEDPNEPADIEAAKRVCYVNNDWFLNVVVRGDWDDDFDGKLDGANDRRADPSLANRSDYLGVNYYSALTASARGLVLPVVNASVKQDRLATPRPKTDFHWDIYPEGLRIVLEAVRAYGKPIVITENGIADAKDVNRTRFILEHLYQVGLALKAGIDVRGYFHWSFIDNFEWASGYCPRFGLLDAAVAPRISLLEYGFAAQYGAVRRQRIDELPPYADPAPCD
jgi:beta-glucosidase